MNAASDNPLKIAFLGLRAIGCGSGGIEKHVEELAVRMAAQGHEVTVFCRAFYNELAEPEFKGVRLVNRPSLYTKHLEAISHTAACMHDAINGFDIVHIHATGPSLLSWVPRLFGRGVVVTVHGLDFARAKWGPIATMVLKCGAMTSVYCPHATIVVSKKLRKHYLDRCGKQTTYIPNGISEPTLRSLGGLKRFGLEEKRYILFLGRLVPEKGAHYLIEAFRQLDTDLKLAIVGGASHSDDYVSSLYTMAAGDPRIVFTGPLFGANKDEAFSNARLFVLPSDLEGMPIVLLEAMSYGCPVLISDIEECVEVIQETDVSDALESDFEEGRLAYTFKAGDARGLARKLSLMIENEDLSPMGARGKAHVLGEYNWDAITIETICVYKNVISSGI